MHFPEPGQSKIPNKIDFSVHAAAALAYLLRMQRDAVGLSVFSDTMEMNTPPRSSSVHHKLLFSQFEDLLRHKGLELAKKTVAASALHEIAETIHRRSLVIIFSDMMDSRASSEELFSALQHLRYNKHEVVLFHVVDKRLEEEFMFENRPYRFVDVESGQEIKVHSNEVRASYVQAMADYKRELKLRCGQYRIDFVEADIRQGFEQVLLPFLLKRERMF